MQLKLFLLPVKNLSAAEAEMNAFLRSHRVLAVKKEFVSDGESSFWTFCVEYLESASSGTGVPNLSGKPKVDYKEVLKPEEFEVFSRLRATAPTPTGLHHLAQRGTSYPGWPGGMAPNPERVAAWGWSSPHVSPLAATPLGLG